jgi:hypothetical protein
VAYKGQTRPLVREGAPQRQDNKFQNQALKKEAISGKTSTKWARAKTYWLIVCHKVNLTLRHGLSSERAPHRDRTTNSRPKHLKRKQYLFRRPQSGLDTRHADWLTVSRKVTLTIENWKTYCLCWESSLDFSVVQPIVTILTELTWLKYS